MADSLHFALTQFRDTMLTAIARLEFTIRDMKPPQHTHHTYSSNWTDSDCCSTIPKEPDQHLVDTLQLCMKRLSSLEQKIDSQQSMVDDILSIQPPSHTRNILIPSVRSTPALAAAVAAANPSEFTLSSFGYIKQESNDEEEEEVESEEEEEEDEEEVEIVEQEEEEQTVLEIDDEEDEEEDNEGHVEEEEDNELQQIVIDGEVYYIDKDQAIYTETDEGYEQIGTYNKQTKTIERFTDDEEVEDEEEEEEEEAEEIAVEDFVYKGKTYQRDEDNNVYLDGDCIGTWNGKKIVKTA